MRIISSSFSLCFKPSNPSNRSIKLVFYNGTTRVLKGTKHVAGEIMFEFPDHMVCHADSFFIGHSIPPLTISAKLEPNNLYFVLPIDKFANRVLSTSSLSLLQSPSSTSSCSSPNKQLNTTPRIRFDQKNPFEFVKGENGRTLIKVVPEFIIGLITLSTTEAESDHENNRVGKDDVGGASTTTKFLCSTPELKKQYEQLVGKEMNWSPKLETISEYKIRFSPCRFIEWAEREEDIKV